MNQSTTIFNNISNPNVTIISSQALKYVQSGCMILCMLGGIFLNVLFIIIVCKSRNFYRRSLFGLCLNLACIFFLDIFINQLLTLISCINNAWIFTDVICIAQSFCINIVDTCLSLTLFTMAIDRLIAIRANVNDKIKLAKGLNKDAIALSILCLWLLSICFSIPLLTKTINSSYVTNKYSCCVSIDDSIIYKWSLFSFTIGLPLLSIMGIYIYIARVWSWAKPEIVKVSLSYTLKEKFQIEKEVNNSLCTFIFQFFWLMMFGPYIVWLYTSAVTGTILVAFFWMRNFFCWLPFFIIVACHKSFRKKLTLFIIGDKARPSLANVVPDVSLNNGSDDNCTNVANSQQSTHSTTLAFNDNNSNMFNNNHRFSYCESEDGNSSLSFSYTSSAVSNHKIEHLPKVPVMFATVSGVHVVNEYFPEIEQSVDNSSIYPATLCDVNEAGFTDTSDAASMATNSSFKNNKELNRIYDVKLPANITETYNPDGFKHKRLKRRPQSNSQKKSLESAFDLPNLSFKNQNDTNVEETHPKKIKKKKKPAPLIPIFPLPKLLTFDKSNLRNIEISKNENPYENDIELDTMSSTNA